METVELSISPLQVDAVAPFELTFERSNIGAVYTLELNPGNGKELVTTDCKSVGS